MRRSVTVSSKGQVPLPKELRDRHNLKKRGTALIPELPEGVLIHHGRTSLRGALKGEFSLEAFEKELLRLRREWVL